MPWKVQGKKTTEHPWRSSRPWRIRRHSWRRNDSNWCGWYGNQWSSFPDCSGFGPEMPGVFHHTGQTLLFPKPWRVCGKKLDKTDLGAWYWNRFQGWAEQQLCHYALQWGWSGNHSGLPGRWNSRPSQMVDPGKNQHEVLGYESRGRTEPSPVQLHSNPSKRGLHQGRSPWNYPHDQPVCAGRSSFWPGTWNNPSGWCLQKAYLLQG